jgi:hypothetical protein
MPNSMEHKSFIRGTWNQMSSTASTLSRQIDRRMISSWMFLPTIAEQAKTRDGAQAPAASRQRDQGLKAQLLEVVPGRLEPDIGSRDQPATNLEEQLVWQCRESVVKDR